MQDTGDSEAFMRRYGALMHRAVGSGDVDAETIASMFADHFVGSGPAGVIDGAGGPGLARVIADGIAAYRRIGGTGFAVEAVTVTALDPLHDRPRVFAWIAGDEPAALRAHGLA